MVPRPRARVLTRLVAVMSRSCRGSLLWVSQGSAKVQTKAPPAPSAARMPSVLVSSRAWCPSSRRSSRHGLRPPQPGPAAFA